MDIGALKQKMIVANHCDRIRDEILAKIESGAIPADWDGHELRSILAEKFAAETTLIMRTNRKRKNKYKNEVIVNNI